LIRAANFLRGSLHRRRRHRRRRFHLNQRGRKSKKKGGVREVREGPAGFPIDASFLLQEEEKVLSTKEEKKRDLRTLKNELGLDRAGAAGGDGGGVLLLRWFHHHFLQTLRASSLEKLAP
jgi:hypothetical protein